MTLRDERPEDQARVYALNCAAFGQEAEARLVDALRAQAQPLVSLVAEGEEGEVLGHILFSPVTLSGSPDLALMGLAPMAVWPALQRKGVGTALVAEGLSRCRALGAAAVVVLGHPEYYPRFGFSPSVLFSVRSTYDVPDEVFMVVELTPGSLRGRSGTVLYHPAFEGL